MRGRRVHERGAGPARRLDPGPRAAIAVRAYGFGEARELLTCHHVSSSERSAQLARVTHGVRAHGDDSARWLACRVVEMMVEMDFLLRATSYSRSRAVVESAGPAGMADAWKDSHVLRRSGEHSAWEFAGSSDDDDDDHRKKDEGLLQHKCKIIK